MAELNEKLRALRESKGWSKSYVANKLNISPQRYSNWEYGPREPDYENLKALAKLYKVDLLEGTDTKSGVTQADLDSPVLSLDGTPITGKEAEDIREFARFKLLQKHLEEEKNNN